MREQKEVKLWNGQHGIHIWDWPDGEERGKGATLNPRAQLQAFFECPSCKEFVPIHDKNVRSDIHGKLYCAKCGDEIVKIHASSPNSEENFRPIQVEVPIEFTLADIMLLPAGKQAICRDWPVKRPLLGIFGINGCGKTMTLYAIYKNLALRGRKGYVMLCGNERARWAQSKDRDAIVSQWKKTPWLLMDDFTSPPATDGWASAMHDLLSERISNRRPTIITTHSNAKEISDKYENAICSRFSSFQWMSLPPVDWRKRMKGAVDEEPQEQTLFDAALEVDTNSKESQRALKIVMPTVGGGA